jgi:hypothetical protein
MDHPMALRSPWYIAERGNFDRFDPRARAPEIQKYDSTDFVDRLVRDPRASLRYDVGDRWTVAVPTGPRPAQVPTTTAPDGTTRFLIRRYLSTHRLVHTPIRKLYQPSHDRFYAVTVELFCDRPGLPRPGPADGVAVRFVLRRHRTTIRARQPGKEAEALAAQRQLTRDFAKEVLHHAYPDGAGYDPDADAARDVTGLIDECLDGGPRIDAFRAKHAAQFALLTIERVLEGWHVRDGVGQWLPVPADRAPDDPWAAPVAGPPPVTAAVEEELSMWRVPASAAGCPAAGTRSLWFGVVPTYSGEFDPQHEPKLDEHTTYVLTCVARRDRTPPHEHCPPIETWSAASRPFRLAAFFDPTGTANRQVRVRLPDLRALAAQAGQPATGGGVQFESPAGSRLPGGAVGEIPKSGPPAGDTAEISGFAIELITIVARFVLALFMPVVLLAFQLWWMLALQFRFPPSAAMTELITLLGTTAIDELDDARKRTLSAAFGVDDPAAVDALAADLGPLAENKAGAGAALAATVQPDAPPRPGPALPEPPTADPLCAVSPATTP